MAKEKLVKIEGTGKGALAVGKTAAVHPEMADRLIKKGMAKKVDGRKSDEKE
jgi:hypothetical protein